MAIRIVFSAGVAPEVYPESSGHEFFVMTIECFQVGTDKGMEGTPTMWNVLRHQIRNYVQNMRKNRDGSSAGGIILTIRKVPVQITVQKGLTAPAQVDWGYVVLNDVTPGGMYVFAPKAYPSGSMVSVTLEEPKRFYARAKVISCQAVNNESRVISDNRQPFRLALEYDVQSEEERASLKAFADEIQQTYLYKRKAA